MGSEIQCLSKYDDALQKMAVDIDYTAEEGYYTVENNSAPSTFNGSLKDAVC